MRCSFTLCSCTLGLLAALAPSSGTAQDRLHSQDPAASTSIPSETTLETWLLSDDPRRVAWGAHDAMLAHDEALVPDLLALAAAWQPQVPETAVETSTDTSATNPARMKLSAKQLDQRDAMAAVLDALIQMQAQIDDETVHRIAADFAVPAAIFLSRMPFQEAQPMALEFFRSSPAKAGTGLDYASAALLAEHPVPGFARSLLSGVHVTAYVHVTTPGESGLGSGFAACCGSTIHDPHPGWPMTGQYTLSTSHPAAASFLIQPGIDPIYVERLETDHTPDFPLCGKALILPSEARRRLIAQLLSIAPEAVGWETGTQTQIVFKFKAQYQRELQALINNQQARFAATAHALIARNLIDPSEIEDSMPQVWFNVIDERQDQSSSLRPPDQLPGNVLWSTTSP